MGTLKTGTRGAGFAGLLIAQLLGALNDNAFKISVTLMAAALLPLDRVAQTIALAGFCFISPLVVFSGFTGALADRFSKKKLLVGLKLAEILLMLASFIPIYYRNLPGVMILLFLMGTHSALFGPVKLAIIPEILEDKDLSRGNGLMSLMSFSGLILGTVSAGAIIAAVKGRYHLAVIFFTVVAALGFVASLFVQDTEAAGPRERTDFNIFAKLASAIKEVQAHLTIYRALMASAYFWFICAVSQMNILIYGKELLKAGGATLGFLQITVAVGIGLGSFAAGRLSKDRVELGLVPLGAFGLVLCSLVLGFIFDSTALTGAFLFLLGFSGGVFILPLTAYIQQRSPKEKRGRFIAAGNIMAFTGVLLASAFLWAAQTWFKLGPAQLFLVLAAMTAVVAAYIAAVLPEFLIRLAVYPVANILYRIKVRGAENFPEVGGALLVSNHISFVDALLLMGACQRPVRFMIHRKYYNLPVLRHLLKLAGCVPVLHSGGPHALAESLNLARGALMKGDIVCIFIEGEISRHGQMLRFRKGYERVVKGLDVPIIPVHLDGVWGRFFTFEGGHPLFKWPRRLHYPVTVSFGGALPPDAPVSRLRLAMQELGSEAFLNRLAEKVSLPLSFVREAKRHWFRFSMADSGGKKLTLGGVLVRAFMLARVLDKVLPPGGRVALAVPPSLGGALANLAVAFLGRVPVNLNYTNPIEEINACAKKAKAEKMLVSKRLAEKMGWPVSGNMIFLEDLAAGISKTEAFLAGLVLFFTPVFLLEEFVFSRARAALDDTATIIFTSGSSGEPKGVVLSHSNIHANIEALAQIYQMTPADRLIGVLPFFHSFGYTVTLWLPLIVGFGVVYHYNPLEAQTVGRLAETHKATMLLATPTFLASYIARIPAEKFRTLRLVVVGAEKLREEVGAAFKEKFGLLPLEGYGCTELSPAASLNIPDIAQGRVRQRGGKSGTIGQPLPGIAMRVVDPETFEPLGADTPGLLLVKGPNVMRGYLDDEKKTAEVIRNGWYVTGDIAAIDEDGFVTITDRLSRFSKIAGEMVPHIKIEETLHKLAGVIERTFVVTSVPDAKRGEKLVVLYKAIADIGPVYSGLVSSGLPNLWLPARNSFYKVEDFPVLGSGKLDMRKVKALAQDLSGEKAVI